MTKEQFNRAIEIDSDLKALREWMKCIPNLSLGFYSKAESVSLCPAKSTWAISLLQRHAKLIVKEVVDKINELENEISEL